MRVLQLGAYPPPYGGVESNIASLRRYLLGCGVVCDVVNLSRHRREDHDGIYYPSSARGVLRRLAGGYDILHLHIGGDFSPRLTGLALACAWTPGKRSVLTFHSGGYPGSPAGRSARPATLRGFVFRQLDCIIGVNAEIVELFRRFGVAESRVRCIAPHWLPSEPPREPLWPALEEFYRSHRPRLLAVSGLEPEYDLALQIRSLGRWRQGHPRAGLAIIGSGSLRDELRRQIASVAWGEHILLCGDVPHPVTLRAIAEADVLLRTTLYDGDAISVREALHLGTPVVATDNGMRPAGVRVVAMGDETALDAALEECLEAERGSGPGAPAGAPAGGDENLARVLGVYEELLRRG
jgi:glycogen(starch) synthase